MGENLKLMEFDKERHLFSLCSRELARAGINTRPTAFKVPEKEFLVRFCRGMLSENTSAIFINQQAVETKLI